MTLLETFRPSRRPRRSGLPALLALLVLLALLPLACAEPEATSHSARGVALDVDRKARTVTLEHEEIPGLMQAMTMTFDVAPDVDLEALAPGTAVEFTLRSQGQSLTVTGIAPAAASPEPAAPSPEAAAAP